MAHVLVNNTMSLSLLITNYFKCLNSADINECAIGTHYCHQDAMCTNTEGSFNCACYPGSIGDGLSCSKFMIILVLSFTVTWQEQNVQNA